MNSTSLVLEDMNVPLDLLEHGSACLSQEINTGLGPPRPGVNRSMDISSTDYGPSNFNNNFRRSPATYNTVHCGPLLFPNNRFLPFHSILLAWRVFHRFHSLHVILRSYFKIQARPSCSRLVPTVRCSILEIDPYFFSENCGLSVLLFAHN